MHDSQRLFVVSIHDVMPETLERVRALFDRLVAAKLTPVTLLVVPGKPWDDASLSELRRLTDDGAVLAGHGWTHKIERYGSLGHRIHSALISRDVAEHLSLDASGISDMITRCHRWFEDHELPVSDLYVPPAWAMGRISRAQLAETPFRLFETFSGVQDIESGTITRTAMVGFEADNLLREVACKVWNSLNLAVAGSRYPVRLGVHPYDAELRLASSLERLLQGGGRSAGYELFRH